MKKFYQVRGWCVRYFYYLSFIFFSLQANGQQVPKSIPAGAPVHNLNGYYESLPADYATSGKKYPLIIFAHGVGELAGAGKTTPLSAVLRNGPPKLINEGKFPASVMSKGQSYSFIVISPQFLTWPGADDVHELLAWLKTIYRIDADRVYMTGLSMGGGVTWGVISENTTKAKLFAAAVPVCGAWNPTENPRTPSLQANVASNNMPVFATHNNGDGTVPVQFSKDWVNGINAITPAPNPLALLTIFPVSGHDAWSKTYDPAYKDPQIGMNIYEWMLQYSRGTVTTPPPVDPPPASPYKRITVKPSSANIIYYDNAMTTLGVNPGDTLCIPPGDYEYIHFGRLLGTADKPIIIRNCDGLVRAGVNSSATSASFVFSTCKYFKVEGTGAAGIEYGFDVNGTNKNGMKMFGMHFGNGTSDFEVHHTYIHDAGMFLQAKTLQSCDHPEWLDGSFTMKNVKIYHLLCRNAAWEGLYIGNTHYLYTAGSCVDMKSHLIENLQVYDNDLENMGSDGIQISTAYNGDNRVYNNRVVNYAMARNSAHGYGILSGGGSSLRIYNNFVSKGYNAGIEIFGSGINHVYNNLVTDVHYEGINVSDKTLFAPATAYIYNNTIYNTGLNGMKIFATETLLGHKIYNNVVITPGTQWDVPMTGYYIKGAKPILYEFSNNINFKTIGEANLVNPLAGDFRLKAGSGAIDIGRNMADMNLTTDFDGKPRPVNIFDAGAFEYNSSNVNILPVANAGEDKVLVPPGNISVSLDGSLSAKDGGTITAYAWRKISGPAATIGTASEKITTVTGLTVGSYIFELKVIDNSGGTATDQVMVTVNNAANKAPVADAGSNITLTLPSNSTQLTGSFSLDPDGLIVKYGWARISGPAAGTMDDAAACNAVVSGLTEGVFVYELTVTDNVGASTSKQVTVTVLGTSANKPPVANAGNDVSITLPVNTASLDGSASADPDGAIAIYAWKKISGPAAGSITTAAASKTGITGLTIAGDYVFELSVTDNAGVSATDQVKITVSAGNKPPVASAGNNTTISLPANSVLLDGSASADPDGTIVKYLWAKISGPTSGAIDNDGAAKATLSGLTEGVFVYELTVTDNSGATNSKQVTITVLAASANKPPVASAGIDVTIILPVNSVSLDGSASSDADGTIASYSWKKVSGPAAGNITATTASKTDITGLTLAGDYLYELAVIDDKGAIGWDYVKITVTGSANKAPIAMAGINATITLPVNSIQLDGSASTDPDGTIASYSWKKLGGPAGGNITVTSAVKTTVTGYTLDGVYVYELTVTDNLGASATSNTTVTVKPAIINKPPVANAGSNVTITLPLTTATLNGNASRDDDGSIISYSWKKMGGPAAGTIVSASAAKTDLTGLSIAGEYIFELTVTDNNNASSKSQVKVVVNSAANKAPLARVNNSIMISLPVSNTSVDGSTSSDEDGTITGYSWKKLSGPAVGRITTPNAAVTTITELTEAGFYVYELTVTDNSNATATATVNITVNPLVTPENVPPVAVTQGNLNIELPVSYINANGRNSHDSDGTISTYEWVQLTGPNNALILDANKSQTAINGLINGAYVFQLTVTDDKQSKGVATFNVTVLERIASKRDTINMYPNPAKDFIRLSIEQKGTYKINIAIYDMNGMLKKQMTTNFIDRLQEDLPVSDLPKGYYIVHVTGKPHIKWTGKFLKID